MSMISSQRVIGALTVLLLAVPSVALPMQIRTDSFYRMWKQHYRESLFNPGRAVTQTLDPDAVITHRFSQNITARTSQLSSLWTLELSGEITRDHSWDARGRIRQLYAERDFFNNWNCMAGKVILRWGTGFVFNPTDVVAPTKDLSDPQNEERREVGNELVKIEYFGPTYSAALCYITDIEAKDNDVSKLAGRLYWNLWNSDLSAIVLVEKERPPLWGANTATAVGERLELHGEISLQRGSYALYHKTISDPNRLYSDFPYTEAKRNSKQLFMQYLLGIQYTLPHNTTWILEYYHQDQGYTEAEWDSITAFARYLAGELQTGNSEGALGNLLWALNVFSPKGATQDYVMNYLSMPATQHLTLRVTCLLNARDRSLVTIPEIRLSTGNHLTFYVRDAIFTGGKGTEFGELFYSSVTEGGVRFRL